MNGVLVYTIGDIVGAVFIAVLLLIAAICFLTEVLQYLWGKFK